MKFLIDQCLSPKLAEILIYAGHDAVHVRDYKLSTAADVDILARAETEARVLITADSDFSSILTLEGKSRPSCILFRGDFKPAVAEQGQALLTSLPDLITHLEKGALIVITRDKLRIRDLPISSDVTPVGS